MESDPEAALANRRTASTDSAVYAAIVNLTPSVVVARRALVRLTFSQASLTTEYRRLPSFWMNA